MFRLKYLSGSFLLVLLSFSVGSHEKHKHCHSVANCHRRWWLVVEVSSEYSSDFFRIFFFNYIITNSFLNEVLFLDVTLVHLVASSESTGN